MTLSLTNLNCNFNGNQINVVIDNTNNKYETVEFECVYLMKNGGTYLAQGSAGLNPGESKEVASNVLASPVVDVESSYIIDK